MRSASKRMGKKGTLTIPQHLRHELGLDGGTAVDLTYEVVTFKGFQICRECFLGIREEVEQLD